MNKINKTIIYAFSLALVFCFLSVSCAFADVQQSSDSAIVASNIKQESDVIISLVSSYNNLDFDNKDSLIAFQNSLPSYQTSLENSLAFYYSPAFLSDPSNINANTDELISKTEDAVDMINMTNSLISSLIAIK